MKIDPEILDWDRLRSQVSLDWLIATPGTGYELMQFTGLHDKNGVEIYEGDIVEGQDVFGVVEWDAWRARYSIELAGTYSSHLEAYDDGRHGHFSRVYVIGNVHENAELLS
jgi:uncharacterized phage protein (TIGR01671 family)